MDLINTCFEMCDYIEQNGIVKLTGKAKLRDNLKKELLHFLIYISMIDGRYGEEEKAFIKKKLHNNSANIIKRLLKRLPKLGKGH